MHTIKLVVIGDSGVGKTSLRGQYISGRFSTGYRATIGTDFITKTLPNPIDPVKGPGVVLQIWDTAGQERFSSLSSAFFRGADAALLMYDVSSPSSLQSLTKWWNEFRERAPVREEEEEDFCVVVVGNKVDIGGSSISGSESNISLNGNGKGHRFGVEQGDADADGQGRSKTRSKGKWRVSEEEALSFVDGLVPHSHSDEPAADDTEAAGSHSRREPDTSISLDSNGDTTPTLSASTSPPITRSKSITITNNTHLSSSVHRHSPSSTRGRSHSSLHYSYGTKNSMSSLATRESMYYTPSSSFLDAYESARSSPIPFPGDAGSSSDGHGSIGRGGSRRRSRTGTSVSPSSASSRSSAALTITQSFYTRSTTPAPAPPPSTPLLPELPKGERNCKLFFTSAKTGEGVSDVFEYIARRVIVKWEWEAREREQYGDGDEWADDDDTVSVGLNVGRGRGRRKAGTREVDGWGMKVARSCCAS